MTPSKTNNRSLLWFGATCVYGHLAESPAPRDAPQDADDTTLPPSHPIRQLVRAAAQLPLAA